MTTLHSILAERYRNLELLGTGQGVETLQAEHASDGAKVVIRAVPAHRVGDQARARLERAIDAVRAVEDATLATSTSVALENDTLYVVRPFVPGVALKDRLARKALTLQEVLAVARALMTALRLAHARGVLHLNIKPSNVIVADDAPVERATLVDICVPRPEPLEGLGRDRPAGDVRYMAPETLGILGRGVEGAADLYSSGVVLYECLAGASPFEGTVAEVLRQHLNRQPPALRSLGVALPRALDDVIARLLRKDPRDRYQSADGVLADLDLIGEALARGEAEPSIVAGARERRRTVAEPALVGRDSEVEALERAVSQAADGHGSLVFVTSDSGGGKTRLLEEIRRRASGAGIWVLEGRGVELNLRGPLQLMGGAAAGVAAASEANPNIAARLRGRLGIQLSAVCEALPVLRDALTPGAPPQAAAPEALGELRTARAVAALLDALGSEGAPAVVLLDDCQWIDELTAKALGQWSGRGVDQANARYVSVIAALRPDELPAEHPLRTATPTLTVALEPLDPEAVRSLVDSMTGRFPRRAVDAVVRLSDGNPFLASAVVRGLVEAEAVVLGPEGWVVDPSRLAEVRSSTEAAEFLAARLKLLPIEVRRVLTAGAILGMKFDVADVADLVGLGAALMEESLAAARHRHLVWSDGQGGYTFVHNRLRATLLELLSEEERRRLHRRAGELLEAREPHLVFQIAHHFDAAGEATRAAGPALEAAEEARARHALELAEEGYRIAERGVPQADRATRARIYLGLGDVLTLRGQYQEAPRWYEQARPLVTDRLTQARVEGKLAEVAFKSSDYDAALQACNAGLRALDRRAPRVAATFFLLFVWEMVVHLIHSALPRLFLARRSAGTPRAAADLLAVSLYDRLIYLWYFAWAGKVPSGWACLKALNLAETYPPTMELGHGYSVLANVIAGGFPRLVFWSLRLREKALAIQETVGSLHGRGQALVYCWPVSHAAMRFDEGIDRARAGRRLLEIAGDQWDLNASYWGVALCQLYKGDVRAAVEECQRLHGAADAIGDYQNVGNALWVWAQASGGRTPAELILAALERPGLFITTRISLLGAEGIRRLGENRPDAALEPLEEACRLALGKQLIDTLIGDVLAWHASALRQAAEQVPAAAVSHREVLLRRAHARARQARFFGHIYPLLLPFALRESGLIAAARGRPGEARRFFDAAIALAGRYGMRLQQALSIRARADVGQALGWSDLETEAASAEQALREMGATPTETALVVEQSPITVSLVDRFEAVLDKGRAIVTALSRQGAIAAIRDAATSLLRAERCVYLDVMSSVEAIAIRSVHPAESDYSRGLVERAVTTGETVAFSADEPGDGRDDLLRAGVKSALCVPIHVRGEVAGCFYVTSTQVPALFGAEEMRLAAFIASLAGAALENVLSVAALEETHLAMQAELERRVAERTAELLAASAAKSDFLASMSHELRTPLNAIIGFSELMRGEPREDEHFVVPAEWVEHIQHSGQHLLSLINDVLDLSKVEAGRLELSLEPFDPRTVVNESVAGLRPLADRKRLRLETAVSTERLVADRGRFRQILYNLLSNAIKFTPESGAIRVEAARNGDEIRLSVTDTGVGIKPEDQAHVFEEFRQVGDQTARQEGTGLGLALTRKLVEAHDGRIELESTPGIGSRFTVVFPLRADATSAAEALPPPAPPPSPRPQGAEVLVIEDDPSAVRLLRTYLEADGYRVRVAGDGERGLEDARREPPAAIVLDVLLPGPDGWEVLRRLKADPALRDIPVVIVTVVDEREIGLALGAVDYFVKPVDRTALLARLARYTYTTKVKEGPLRVLVADDDPATLDFVAHTLLAEGFDVVRASGGGEVVARLREGGIQLVICDLLMPDLDGFGVVAELKADERTRDVPILILTAHELSVADKARLNGKIVGVVAKGADARAGLSAWLARTVRARGDGQMR